MYIYKKNLQIYKFYVIYIIVFIIDMNVIDKDIIIIYSNEISEKRDVLIELVSKYNGMNIV